MARSPAEAHAVADNVGFPVLLRPSFVLGGRAMAIVYDHDSIDDYMEKAVYASPERPVLIDHYLEDAYELDVDAVADGKEVVIGAIMQHIEEAGIHSGDSALRDSALHDQPAPSWRSCASIRACWRGRCTWWG